MKNDTDTLPAFHESMLPGGLTMREYPDLNSGNEFLTFQAGRYETIHVVVPAHVTIDHREVEFDAEVFRLIAFASTESELLEKLKG